MSQAECKSTFDRDGYTLIRQFLDDNEISELTQHLDRYIREVVPGLPATHAFYQDPRHPETLKQLQFMEQDPFFKEYPRREKWMDLAQTLVGEPVNPSVEWFNKPPRTHHVTPPHQDNYYFCMVPPHVVTLWLALDPVDDQNGCLSYVKGSHLQGIRPHNSTKIIGFSQGITDYGEQDRSREVAIHLSPGDLAAHHGNMIHSANANRSSSRHRRAFALVYKGESCRLDQEASRRYRTALQAQHQQAQVL